MSHYLLDLLIAYLLSTLFAMAGAGSGIALIPVLHLMGIDFNLAKAVGLFTGFTTTVTSSVMNFRRKVLEVRFALPLAVTMPLAAPVGAQLSRYLDETVVKTLFVLFLLFSATMMMFFKKEAKAQWTAPWILAVLGVGVGVVAGLLGVGGGNLLLPVLILLGFPPKKVAIAVSFVVPFTALGAFLSYADFVPIDWGILTACALGAVAGGYTGNRLMHEKLSQAQIRKVVALILYLLAARMGWTLVQGA